MDNLSPRLEGATSSAAPTRTPSTHSSLQERSERNSPRAGSASPSSPPPSAALDAQNGSLAHNVAQPDASALANLPSLQQQKSVSRRSSRGLKKSPSNHSLPHRSGAGDSRSQAESQTGHGAGKATTAGEAVTASRRGSRIEAAAAASTPSFPVTSPDAFDAIVRASNPMHPDHAAWIERFGTLSRSGNKALPTAASGSNSDIHGSPNGLSPPNGGTSGSIRRGGGTSSSQQAHRAGEEPTSPPATTRSKRSASKSSQHSAAAARAAATAFPVVNGQKSSGRTRRDGSDRDSDDAALAAGPDGQAAGDASVVGNGSGFLRPPRPGSVVEGAEAAKRRRRRREASNSTTNSPKGDKGKGKASPPPVPPPRITSSLNYLATVVGGDGDGSPASPTAMTPSSTFPDATQGTISSPRSVNGHDAATSPQAFPPSGYDSNNGSRQSFSVVRGTQSMDGPRVAQRTSSMFGEQDRPNMEDLAKAQQARQPQQQEMPPVPPVPGWADTSLRSSRSGSKQSLREMVSSVTGTGRRRSGSVRSISSSKEEDRSITGPYGVSSMSTTLNGRPTEARHLSTVYQEDTEAADEFFDANDDEPGSEMHAASQKAAGATIPLLHTNGALTKDDIRSSGSGKQGRRGGGGSSKHSASYHSQSSKGTSPPIKDMSDREKRQFLAQNTYYIPPASRSSANASTSPPIGQQSDSALLRSATSSPNLVPPKRPPKKNRGAHSAKATSEAGFSAGAESAKTTGGAAAEAPPPFPRRGSFWSKFSGLRRKQEDANFNEFAASIGLHDSPGKANQSQPALPESPANFTKEEQLPPSPAPEDSSWRAKLFSRAGSKSPNVTPKSPPRKSFAANAPQDADRWRHDILSEAVTRSLAAPSTPTAAPSSPKPRLAEDDFPEETTKKSLSPRLLSDEAGAASREGTWRSMASAQENDSTRGSKQENGFVDDSRASPFLEQEGEEVVEEPQPAASSPGKRPPSVLGKGFASVVSLPAGRTSFSQDRNREPVMSPMLMAQQQTPQVKSPGLLGAFKDRFKSPRPPTMGQPIDSNSYQGIDRMLSPASSVRSPNVVPPSPTKPEARPPPIVVQGVGLGIEESGSELHGASSPTDAEAPPIDSPPAPPAKQSNDVKAFDDMLKGFGQADKQVRDTITMRAQEHFEKPI